MESKVYNNRSSGVVRDGACEVIHCDVFQGDTSWQRSRISNAANAAILGRSLQLFFGQMMLLMLLLQMRIVLFVANVVTVVNVSEK